MNAYSIAATTPLSFGLQPSSRDTSQQKRKARILVVDDDPGLLRLLTIRLRAENYEVEAVESAAAALAACMRFRPDLVITDLRMDQMDGIGLLKELQSRWPGPARSSFSPRTARFPTRCTRPRAAPSAS